MAAATAGLCCPCLSSPPPQTFESMAARLPSTQREKTAFTAAISAGLLKPLRSLSSANSASSPSSTRGLTEEQRFPLSSALSNVGPVAPWRTYHLKGDGGRPKQQQESGLSPRPPVILWEKDIASAVQLIGRVGRDIEIKYLDSGKAVATTSLTVHKGSQRTKDLSRFTLEIWNGLAEIAAHHMAKGELLFVAGKIFVERRVKDDVMCTTVKVFVRDLCLSNPPVIEGNPTVKFTVRGFSSQSQAEVASMDSSQRNWNQQQLSSPPSPGDIKANLNISTRAIDMLEIRKPEPLSREEEGQSSPISEGGVTVNLVRQALRIEKLLSGQSTQGRLQSRASYSSRDWSRDTAQGKDSTHMRSGGTTSEAIAVLQNRLQRGITRMYISNVGGWSTHAELLISLRRRVLLLGTNIIAGYAKSDHAKYALELFNAMRQEGVKPNEITYLSILKGCTSLLALKEIHGCIRHAGFESDVRVGTALLKMYAKCGCIMEASQVFENLTSRDVLMDWNDWWTCTTGMWA